MRRRRGNNRLLMRIIGISIVVHIFALPVLAHYGAFKKIQQHFLDTRLITLPPPVREKEKPEVRKQQRVAHRPPPTAKRSTTTAAHQQAARRSNLTQPKVIASASTEQGGGNGEPTVDANGTGKAGVVPTPQTQTTPTTVKETPPPPKTEAPKTETSTPPKTEAAPPPKVETPPPPKVETPPPPKREPIFTEVVPTYSPQPAIPDDLRSDALDKTCVAEFTVSPDGTPTAVTMSQSTGNDELDRIALDTARKWRFKPATRDGEAIESHVRLHIEFQVQ